MRRLVITIATLAATTAAYSQSPHPPAAKGTAKKPEAAKPKTIPNPNWIPKPGDTAEVIIGDAPACLSEPSYAEYAKSMKAKDRVGMDKVSAEGAVAKIPRGVHVLVLKTFRPGRVSMGPRIQSTESYTSSLLAAGFAARDETIYPLEVRFLDGDLKGTVRYVPELCVAQMIPVPSRVKRKGVLRPADAPIDHAKRSASLLQMAKNLEKLKKPKAALESYRQILADYPASPEAKEAAARVKVLEGK